MRNKISYFERSFDIDWMLYDTAIWLTEQTGRPAEDFVQIAIAIDTRSIVTGKQIGRAHV